MFYFFTFFYIPLPLKFLKILKCYPWNIDLDPSLKLEPCTTRNLAFSGDKKSPLKAFSGDTKNFDLSRPNDAWSMVRVVPYFLGISGDILSPLLVKKISRVSCLFFFFPFPLFFFFTFSLSRSPLPDFLPPPSPSPAHPATTVLHSTTGHHSHYRRPQPPRFLVATSETTKLVSRIGELPPPTTPFSLPDR